MAIDGIVLIVSGVTAAGLIGVPFIGAVGFVLIAIGIAFLGIAWGLITGKGWAWIVTVILSIIAIITSTISIAGGHFGGIIHLIISGVILYYMYRPDVKSYFGRSKTSI
jgi:hypothetical protein